MIRGIRTKRISAILSGVLLLFIITSDVSAQQNSFYVKYAPLSLIDINTPVVQLGIEYRSKRIGLQGDYGIASPAQIGQRNNSLNNHQYFKVRSEFRYYPNWIENQYFATEYFFIPRAYIRTNDYYYARNGDTYDYESSRITHNVWGLSAKFGFMKKVADRWYMDAYAGLGFRNVTIRHNPTNPTLSTSTYFEEWFTPRDKSEGTFILPHVALGFKIAYSIPIKKSIPDG